MAKKSIIPFVALLSFSAICIFLTFNWHRMPKYFSYHSELWSDKAGYNVYLPALKFKFNPANFPDSIEQKTGFGFKVDYSNKKIITKYTCGVALLQLPFFLVADLLAVPLGMKPDGFSPVYQKAVNVASVFYLVIGLWFLYRFLIVRYNPAIVILVLLSIFLGTNLYYYSIAETGMSHVYSFFLFSFIMFYLQKVNYLSVPNHRSIILLGLVSGLIVLVRPTNSIFLFVFVFINTNSFHEIVKRLTNIFNPHILIPLLCFALLPFIPQVIYWYHTFNTPITYSYGNEGFNWLNPQILKTWFSPNNGLFLYSPFYAVIIFELLIMSISKSFNGIFIFLMFLGATYIFSSWWAWNFGCSFGARNYVEYLVLLSIPIASFYTRLSKQSNTVIVACSILLLTLITFNIKMTYSSGGCYYGSSDWDWKEYIKMIKEPTK